MFIIRCQGWSCSGPLRARSLFDLATRAGAPKNNITTRSRADLKQGDGRRHAWCTHYSVRSRPWAVACYSVLVGLWMDEWMSGAAVEWCGWLVDKVSNRAHGTQAPAAPPTVVPACYPLAVHITDGAHIST